MGQRQAGGNSFRGYVRGGLRGCLRGGLRGGRDKTLGLGVLGAIACLIFLTAACNRPTPQAVTIPQTSSSSSPPLSAQVPVEPLEPLVAAPVEAQPIQIERMVADLQNLEGERHSAGDRAQTREYLRRSLQSTGWQVEEQPFETGVNLVATWPLALVAGDRLSPSAGGTSPKLLVGAHYDTVAGSPGADDNATGVAALLEIGRVYTGAADLMLVFFDREEQGLEGSLAFATPERVAELSGAIVLEMLGFTCQEAGCQSYPEFLETRPEGDRGDFIAVIGDAEHPELLRAFEHADFPSAQTSAQTSAQNSANLARKLARPLAPVFTLSVPLKGVMTPDVLRSDHAPFWLRGLGAVMVTDTANLRNPYYHRAGDRLETLDLPFLEQVTRRVVVAIAQLQSSLSSAPPR